MRYVLVKAGATEVQLPDGAVYDAAEPIAIASSTNATPIQVNTTTPHGLTTGDLVYIAGHATNTPANGLFSITVVDGDSFTLDDSVGTGSGTGGTARSDIISITNDQFEAISPTALDGDPLIDLGEAPGVDGDEVTQQGVAATTTATAPVALTYVAPAALTSSQNATTDAATQGGSYVQADVQSIRTLANALKASYNQAQADIVAIRTALVALGVDVAAIRTRSGTVISELVALDAALSGAGKALAS